MSDKPSTKPITPKAAAKAVGASSSAKNAFEFLAAPQEPDEIGRLEHYRVLRVLGKGAMGTVFMAEDTKLHRIVALKVMLPAIAKKEVARDRFRREARATAAIEHDHIITIYDVSREDYPVPYAAMQYLKGATLEDWLRAGKTLNVPQIMRIGKEIAKGLAAAHARGLIHRDIKPSNIWLDAVNKGRVKILDFGLARPTNTETHLTQEGLILGTPAYMSPEQARGQEVDERCDLFSLGCVLYRLCAGKLPFMGKDVMSMILAIQADEPPALQPLNTDVPAAFADLIDKLLAKKPADRPASARAVVAAIQGFEREWIARGKSAAFQAAPKTFAASAHQTNETAAAQNVELVDPALEESAIMELDLVETPRADDAEPPPRGRGWLLAGLAAAAVAVVSIVCCLGMALLADHGFVEIIAEDDTAKRLAEDAGLKVWDDHNQEHTVKIGVQNRLAAGHYRFEQAGLPNGLHFEPNPFSLPRGELLTIKISYVTPKSNKALRPLLVVVKSEEAKALQKEWAAFLQQEVTVTTSLGAKMVLIPPGEFTMGATKEQLKAPTDFLKKLKKEGGGDGYLARLAAEMPPHRVQITRPFYLGATEVTFGQFKRFVAAKGYTTEPRTSRKGGTGLDAGKDIGRKPAFDWLNGGPSYKPNDASPVSNVTWKDADAFCAWLSAKESKTYRLPTEAEWEYACRAGAADFWSFGDELREGQARMHMWYHSLQKAVVNPATPSPVAQKNANAFGLFDMHGNVAEMTADLWGPSYYDRCLKENLVTDPQGPEVGRETSRVVRGGSFIETAYAARSGYRSFLDPKLGHVHVGFRVVCEVPLPD